MMDLRSITFDPRHWVKCVLLLTAAATLTLLSALPFLALDPLQGNVADLRSIAAPSEPHASTPWIYGHADARFSIIEYADLQCPYCAQHFTMLRNWIKEHPEVNWQWRHLPLVIHEPAATQAARWIECVGATRGNEAFWEAISQHYTRLSAGLATETFTTQSSSTPAMNACLTSAHPDLVIQAHSEEAARHNVTATPTLLVKDQHTRKTLLLRGPADGDVLLSAIDALVGTRRPL